MRIKETQRNGTVDLENASETTDVDLDMGKGARVGYTIFSSRTARARGGSGGREVGEVSAGI